MKETEFLLARHLRVGFCVAALFCATAPAALAQEFAPLPEPPEVNGARAKLGEMLFFDSRLSGDTGNSCASCHNPTKGWGDGLALSTGYTGVEYFRNAPGLFNVANRNYLMWDGRLDGADLGTLVRDMLTEAHTMNMDTRLAQERLKQVPEYDSMFHDAYGAEPYGGRIYGAIAEYIKSIRTVNAPFDAYMKGNESALSDQAKRGMELFAGKANCSIRLDQAVFSTQIRSALTSAFAISMSLRMMATIATLAGFPAARRSLYLALRFGL